MNKTLTTEEEKQAKTLYEEFWNQYPNIPNPSDINSIEKNNFLKEKGFECIQLMQKARKQAYEFTKKEYFDKK